MGVAPTSRSQYYRLKAMATGGCNPVTNTSARGGSVIRDSVVAMSEESDETAAAIRSLTPVLAAEV